MSSVATSAAPSASSSSCSTADFTQLPTQDIACAVGSTTGVPPNTSSVLSLCCKSAPVEQFNGNCGFYCLSVQQTVAELQACFMLRGGVAPNSIFCSGNNTATATGSGSGRPASSASPTTGSGAASPGAAAGVRVPVGVSKAGAGMLGMLIVSVLVGAFV